MAVTIRDVAQAAGVSPMTVSKVLHGRGENVRVSEATAQHIRQIAEDLNYQPNNLARSLRMQRTQNVGIVFEQWRPISSATQFFALLFDGVTSVAFDRGYSVSICPRLNNIASGEGVSDGRFDGLIWCKFSKNTLTERAVQRSRIPVVMLHASPGRNPIPDTNYIVCDNEHGMELAIDHLWKLGHRRIGFVVEFGNLGGDETEERVAGFRNALTRRGALVTASDLLIWNESCDELPRWFDTDPPQTALIFRSELQALNALAKAREADIKVPDQLSIVGFDSTAACEASLPRLTSIYQPIEEMASKAAELLFDILDGRGRDAQHYTYACGFDTRDSTARPPSKMRFL